MLNVCFAQLYIHFFTLTWRHSFDMFFQFSVRWRFVLGPRGLPFCLEHFCSMQNVSGVCKTPIQITDTDTDYGYGLRIRITDTDYGYGIRIRIRNTEYGKRKTEYRIRIRNTELWIMDMALRKYIFIRLWTRDTGYSPRQSSIKVLTPPDRPGRVKVQNWIRSSPRGNFGSLVTGASRHFGDWWQVFRVYLNL